MTAPLRCRRDNLHLLHCYRSRRGDRDLCQSDQGTPAPPCAGPPGRRSAERGLREREDVSACAAVVEEMGRQEEESEGGGEEVEREEEEEEGEPSCT